MDIHPMWVLEKVSMVMTSLDVGNTRPTLAIHYLDGMTLITILVQSAVVLWWQMVVDRKYWDSMIVGFAFSAFKLIGMEHPLFFV